MAEGYKNRVISRRMIREFLETHPGLGPCRDALMTWYRTALHAPWANFSKVRESYPSADAVGRFVVFNIAGNKVCLIAEIRYRNKPRIVYIRDVLTHAEYDEGDWKD